MADAGRAFPLLPPRGRPGGGVARWAQSHQDLGKAEAGRAFLLLPPRGRPGGGVGPVCSRPSGPGLRLAVDRVYGSVSRRLHNLRPLRAQRRALRRDATPAERRLWAALRRRQLDGWRWRRQYSVGCYVLDFFCPAARLAIELDGSVHDDPARAAYDYERTRWLWRVEGIRVIRFENAAVCSALDVVIEAIPAELGEPG